MRGSRQPLALVVGLVAALMIPGAAHAADQPIAPTADQVLVRYRADTTPTQRAAVAREHALTVLRSGGKGRNQVVVGRGQSAATVRRLLRDDPRVEAVSPNYQRELTNDITDEPLFSSEWGLNNTGQSVNGTAGTPDVDIDGLEALGITRGSHGVVVAVIDDGIDFDHPDLMDRIWTNPGEIPNDGIDNDQNGYKDDVHGWDFCHNDANPAEVGDDAHGTHVSGTIAASLNGVGVVGVAPDVTIMPLKAFEGTFSCHGDASIANAIDYAASKGVPIINASWGAQGKDPALEKAIADFGALFVAAAGNYGLNLDASADSGGGDFYPAESTVPNVLSVAAINQHGGLAWFSNYGATTVDVAAPGTNIWSTWPGGGYKPENGTSMAAPHVSGVAALGLSVAPGLSTAALKLRIMSRGVTLAGVVGKTVTGKLVNALRVADVVGPMALPVTRHGINIGSTVGSSLSTTIIWPPATDEHTGVASYIVRRRVGTGSWSIIASALTTRSLKVALPLNTSTQFGIAARDGVGNVGPQAVAPTVTGLLLQDGTSLARYTGSWSVVTTSSASNGKLHSSTRAGSSVEFTTTARSIAVVGRKRPGNGQARVYVDGVYVKTIDFYRSTSQSKVVVFNQAWSTNAVHSVKLVVVGTSGRPRVEVDAFAILR